MKLINIISFVLYKLSGLVLSVSVTRILLLIIINHFSVNGQQFRFTNFSVEDGLQNNIVFASVQDSKGMMWFATRTGIDRFDGYRFIHYLLPGRKNMNVQNVQVSNIVKDDKQRIWAHTSSLLYLYDVTKDAFNIPYLLDSVIGSKRTINYISTGSGGKRLIIGTNSGFVVYDHDAKTIAVSINFNKYVRSVFQDERGLFWVGTNQGLQRFILHGSGLYEIREATEIQRVTNNMVVTGISKDTFGKYWITESNGGLLVYDEGNDKILSPSLPKALTRSYVVKDILHDRGRGGTFVTMDGAGMVFIDRNLKVVQQFQTNEDDLSSLSSNAAYDVYADDYQRIWVTTYGGGINMMNSNAQPFTNFQHEINSTNSLSNNSAKSVIEDERGILWFGTRKGISTYDPIRGTWKHFNEQSSSASFTSDNVLALISDHLGNSWVGTYGGGLMKIDQRTGQITKYLSTEKDTNTLGTDFVYSLLHDRGKRIWAGGIRGDLSYLDIHSKKFTRIKTKVYSINCLIEDSNGRILAGTEKGLYEVSGDSLKVRYPALEHERIISLLEYQPGKLWVGTFGNGILVYDIEKGIHESIRAKDGLPSDVISTIEKDKTGDLWIGTTAGIAHYHRKARKITTYTRADGLAGSQVNFGASGQTRKGALIFGTTNGFSLFDPSRVATKGYKPKIVLTDLMINNRQVVIGDQNGPLSDSQLDEKRELRLKHDQHSFIIEFVNTAPALSGKHLYSWKLDGFDKDWSMPSINNRVIYTNLNPGIYTLGIKSFAKGHADDTQVRSITIYVSYPWWRSIWAYLLYLISVIVLGLIFYHYFQNILSQKKYSDRLKINTAISHEIRTPLTLIKGPVSALLTASGIPNAERENLKLAHKNIEKLEAIISQFIDYQKSAISKIQLSLSMEDLSLLLDEVIESFKPLIAQKNIDFIYTKPNGPIHVMFDRGQMERVINNLLSNALKYTPAFERISVELRREGKYVQILVSDTGIGIPAGQQRSLLKGYFRADNALHLKETGSGIGLVHARELMELHRGKLTFSSKEGSGSTFLAALPIPLDKMAEIKRSVNVMSSTHLAPEAIHIGSMPVHRKKLLIAEDNDELRSYLMGQMVKSGYEVRGVADGKKAMEEISKCLPDLLITDVMMPEMNGFQLCQAIKSNIISCHIPVIMLTAIHDRDYLLDGYRSGADDFVRKPFDTTYILTRIENLLENRSRFHNRIMRVFEADRSVVDEDPDIRWLKDVTSMIAENLGDPDFSVEKLCRGMAMSRPVLFRKFKAITGLAPQPFIQQLRLRRAVEMLQSGVAAINEVAFECGFSDPRYFSTTFKKHFGKTPTAYLEAHRSGEALI